MSARIPVMLLTKVPRIGGEKEVIQARKGFAMNYLIPQGLAKRATKEDIAQNEERAKLMEAKAKERDAKAVAMREKMVEEGITLKVKTTAKGGLYGKISADLLAGEITTKFGWDVDGEQVQLPKAIKEAGTYMVKVKLSSHVMAELPVTIEAE